MQLKKQTLLKPFTKKRKSQIHVRHFYTPTTNLIISIQFLSILLLLVFGFCEGESDYCLNPPKKKKSI